MSSEGERQGACWSPVTRQPLLTDAQAARSGPLGDVARLKFGGGFPQRVLFPR